MHAELFSDQCKMIIHKIRMENNTENNTTEIDLKYEGRVQVQMWTAETRYIAANLSKK